jgi:hypothetical protein
MKVPPSVDCEHTEEDLTNVLGSGGLNQSLLAHFLAEDVASNLPKSR